MQFYCKQNLPFDFLSKLRLTNYLPHEKNTIPFKRFTMAHLNESCNNLHYHYFQLKHKLLLVEATDYSNLKEKHKYAGALLSITLFWIKQPPLFIKIAGAKVLCVHCVPFLREKIDRLLNENCA